MLSLSPRYDLFKFQFPRDFIPRDIDEKYSKLINEDPGVITTCIDYLNESIQGVNLPGISDVNVTQTQHSYNSNTTSARKLNVEPKTDIIHTSTSNPLDKINKEFKGYIVHSVFGIEKSPIELGDIIVKCEGVSLTEDITVASVLADKYGTYEKDGINYVNILFLFQYLHN